MSFKAEFTGWPEEGTICLRVEVSSFIVYESSRRTFLLLPSSSSTVSTRTGVEATEETTLLPPYESWCTWLDICICCIRPSEILWSSGTREELWELLPYGLDSEFDLFSSDLLLKLSSVKSSSSSDSSSSKLSKFVAAARPAVTPPGPRWPSFACLTDSILKVLHSSSSNRCLAVPSYWAKGMVDSGLKWPSSDFASSSNWSKPEMSSTLLIFQTWPF